MSDLNVYTTSQINALTPITGDMVVDSDLNAVKLYDGAAWRTWNSDSVAGGFENRWGASFDGTDDYIQLPNGVLTALSGTAYTISAWFNLDIVGNYQMIFSASSNLQIYFRPRVTQVGLELYVNGATRISQFSTYSNVGSWVHGCISVDTTGTSTMYINGSLNTSSISVPQATSISNPVIGSFNGASLFLNGYVDDFAIFNSALDQTAVTALYGAAPNAGIPSEVTGAIGYWRMGDDSNDSATSGGSIATITDSSGNGNDATQSTASAQPTFSDLTGETIYV
ncbi:MAG TPA: hypothetical protein DCS80_08160 [Betaproteobacteria bacterium]|nr:hypothetical protein [Betaproteobacteria bacterium]